MKSERIRWISVAALIPIAVAMVTAAVWAEIAQAVFGLADLTSAACADPSNGINPAGAAGGVAAGGAAAGGAAAGGGVNDRTRDPRIPDPYDDMGDQTPPFTLPYRPPFEPGPLLRFSRLTETWVNSMIGVDSVGTVPGTGKIGGSGGDGEGYAPGPGGRL